VPYTDKTFHQIGGAKPALFLYVSQTDPIATISLPNYFERRRNLRPSDTIFAISRSVGIPEFGIFVVNDVDPQLTLTDVTVTGGGGGGLSLAQIIAGIQASGLNFITTAERNAIANLGSAAFLDAGFGAGQLPILDSTGQLPGSILNNAPGGSSGGPGVSLPVDDNVALVRDPLDNTKTARLDVGAVGSGQTRVITVPDEDVDLGEFSRTVPLSGGAVTLLETAHRNALIELKSGVNVFSAPSSGTGSWVTTVLNETGSSQNILGTSLPNGEMATLVVQGTSVRVFTTSSSGPANVTGAVVVETIADLLAIEPVAGEHIFVSSEDDFFKATNSGLASDGALVFHYPPDESAEQTLVVPRTQTAYNLVTLAPNVAWGSASMEIDAASGPVTVSDIHFHGHRTDSNDASPSQIVKIDMALGALDYLGGEFKDRGRRLQGRMLQAGATQATFRYKTIGNPRRWERVTDGEEFHYRWMGSPPGDINGSHALCWATNLVRRYGFTRLNHNSREILQSGIVEYPVNISVYNGKIKLRDGFAIRHLRTNPPYDFSDPEYYVDQMINWVGIESTDEEDVYFNMDEFEIDGNIPGNLGPLINQADYGGGAGLNIELANSATWSAFYLADQSARLIPKGRMNLGRVHFHDTGSSTFLGHFHWQIKGERVTLGNSFNSHLIYAIQGSFDHLEFYGFAGFGGHGKTETATIGHFRADKITDNPYNPPSGGSNQIVSYEGGDTSQFPEPSRFDHPGFFIKSGIVDFKGSTEAVAFGIKGWNFSIEDLTVLGGENWQTSNLFKNVSNVPSSANQSISLKNIMVVTRSLDLMRFLGDMRSIDVSLKNISVRTQPGYPSPTKGSVGTFVRLTELDPAIYTEPQSLEATRQVLDGLTALDAECYGIARLGLVTVPGLPVRSARLKNVNAKVGDCQIVSGVGASGQISSLNANIMDMSRFQIDWEDCRFVMAGFTNFFLAYSLFLATAHSMKNVVLETNQANDGDVFSEQVGEFEYTAVGGEAFVDVPTNLLWVPKYASNVRITAMNSETVSIIADSLISFRNRNGTRDLEWDSYPGRDLSSSRYEWVASGSGTSEYYLQATGGGDPSLPRGASQGLEYFNEEGVVSQANHTLGSLASGEAKIGDNDGLGFNTIYVRLSDNSNPNSKVPGALRYIAEEAASSPTGNKHQPRIRVNFLTPPGAGLVVKFNWEARVI